MHKKGVLMIQMEWLSPNDFFFCLFLHQEVSYPILQMTQAGAPPHRELKFPNISEEKGCCPPGYGHLPCALLSRGNISTFSSSQHSSWAGKEPHTYRCAGKRFKKQKKSQKQLIILIILCFVGLLINDVRSFRVDRVQDKLNLNLVHSSA